MRILKKGLLLFLGVFAAIQFIRPDKNVNREVSSSDIIHTYSVPGGVEAVFKKACNDCHSDSTRYPWYVNIEPVGWMMARHIKNGKANLNFSEFGSYSVRRQANKLRSIENSINEGSMPLYSYTLIHKDARLSKEEKALITDWTKMIRDSLSSSK